MKFYPNITVKPDLLDRDSLSRFEKGSYSIILNTPSVESRLKATYGRKGLCLKVLKGMTEGREVRVGKSELLYGKVSLLHATLIQNRFARKGLSPRVFGWAVVNGLVAQVMPYIVRTRDPAPEAHDKRVQEALGVLGELDLVNLAPEPDLGVNNWRGGKLVDFSHFEFRDFEGYLENLDVRARTRRGVVLDKAYQAVPPTTAVPSEHADREPAEILEIAGTRDNGLRVKNLQLEKIRWKGKNVLDVGCNLGAYSRYAVDAGARRVIGVDRMGDLAFEVNNVLGYWNLDVVQTNLPGYFKKVKMPKIDYVFMMAFHSYVGGLDEALKFVFPVVKTLLILESHGGEDQAECEEVLRKYFSRIDYLGFVKDPQVRHQWHCWV